MAFADGSDGFFSIVDTGAQARDMSPYINEVGGLPGPRALNDVTGLGDAGRKSSPGIQDVKISLRGSWNEIANVSPDVVLGALRTHTAPTAFIYGPEGNATQDIKYSGTCWVVTYELRSRVGNLVEWSASLQVEGTVTRGTF